MNTTKLFSKLFGRMGYLFRRFFLLPDSFGVKAFHVMVAISMITPNFLGVASLVQAGRAEASAIPSEETYAGLSPQEIRTLAQTHAQQLSTIVTPVPSGPADYQQPGIISEADTSSSPAVEEINQESFVMDANGGILDAKNGKIQVAFTSGIVTQTLDIQVSDPVGETRPPYSLSGEPFRITAFDQVTGDPVTQFAEPITITVAYTESNLTGPESSLSLFYYDTTLGTWVPLPSRVFTDTNLLVAQTDHFTDFDIDVNSWQAGQLPNLQGYQVSSFTGAAIYSYPFWVPPGPGGLQPSLVLSYNSQTVDSATARTQASWVGMGWSLDVGYIERNMNGTNDFLKDDTFNLVVNGVSSMLLQLNDIDGESTTIDYRTANETFWRVRYFNKDYSGGDFEKDSWVVWDNQGNTYYFGEPENGGLGDRARYQTIDWDKVDEKWVCNAALVTWKWGISRSENIYGQSLTYNYTRNNEKQNYKCDDDGDGEKENHYSDAALYPAEIIYPNHRYKIVFSLQNRSDYDNGLINDNSANLFERSMLNNISIQHDTTGEGTWNTIRSYDFIYNEGQDIFPRLTWPAGGKFLTLTSIQEIGLGGDQLPATTFSYDGVHLDYATNGYGGWVDFDYQVWFEQDRNVITDTKVLKGRKMVFDFSHPLSCGNNGDDTEGWGSREHDNAVHCNGEERLQIDNVEAWHSISENMVQPNGMYILRANLITPGQDSQVRFGLSDGTTVNYDENWHHFGSLDWYEVAIWLPSSTEKYPELRIDCEGICEVADFVMIMAPTRYRVTTKTLNTSNGDSYAFYYCYTDDYLASSLGSGGANCVGNDTAKTSNPDLRDREGDNPYSENFSDFNGNEIVTLFAPNGIKTVTKFCQKDFCDANGTSADPDGITSTKGNAKWIKVYDSNGQLVSRTETHYEVSYQSEDAYAPFTLVMPKDPDGDPTNFYTGLDAVWARTAYQISATCEGVENCLEFRTSYAYNPTYQGGSQFGNMTDVVEAYKSGENWIDYRATRTWYYPNLNYDNYQNVSLPYLVSLPSATNLYRCPNGVCGYASTEALSVQHFLYDTNATWNQVPSTGILAKVLTLVDATHAQFNRVDYTYDDWGNQTTTTTYTEYQEGNNVNNFTPGGSQNSTNLYDATYHTYLEEVQGPLYSSNNFPATFFGYDKDKAVVTSITDPNGNTTTAEYDAFGRLMAIRKPGDENNPEGTINPTISIAYNDDDGLESFYPFSTTATQKIDDTGKEISIQKYYDGLGRLVQTHALNVEITDEACTGICDILVFYQYDDAGRPLKQSIPMAYADAETYLTPPATFNGTSTIYDSLGRPLTVTAPDGTVQNYAYTLNSQNALTYAFDPRWPNDVNKATKTYTNVWGQVEEVVPPTVPAEPHPAISYTYDPLGRLTGVVKDSLHTEIQYDMAGRKTYMNDPDMGVWTYEYDALGNLRTQTDANDVTISFTYDALNRLETKAYSIPVNSNIVSPGDVTYRYDNYSLCGAGLSGNNTVGQRTCMFDGTGRTAWTYDERGRVVEVTRSFYASLGVLEGPYTFHYTYNKANMVETTQYPDGEIVTNHYTENGMPKFITSVLNPATPEPQAYTYVKSANFDALGRMRDLTLGNNLTTTYAYYAFSPTNLYDGRLQSITISTDENSLLNLVYNEYDAAGNIKQITDNASNGDTQTRIFTYDELSRLQTADATTAAGGTLPGYHESYNYDSLGRLASKTEEGVTSSYTYDPNHPHAATALGNDASYQYDANGNMIFRQEDGTAYDQKWTADNKLYQVNWTKNSQAYKTTFVYDGDGNRLLKIEDIPFDNGTRENTTLYLGGLYEQQFDTSGVNLSDSWVTAYFPGAGMLLVSDHGATMVSFTPPIWNYALARLNQALQEFAEKLRAWGRQVQANWQAFWAHPEPANETAQTDSPKEGANAENPEADWLASAYAGIAAQEYFVTADEQAYQAPNRAQDVRTRFETDGSVSWTDRTLDATASAWEVAWTLIGVGHETAMQRVDKPVQVQAVENRFEYAYTFGEVGTGLTAWYLNTEQGVEQGFTLAARPAGKGWLVLEGATNLQVIGEDQAVLTENGVVLLTYSGLKAWDATGKLLETRLEGTQEGMRILVADANALYPITVDPLVQTPSWTVVGTQANAQLGFSVSTAGDVNGDGYADVLVGAPYFDGGLTDEGAAFIYLGGAEGLNPNPAWSMEGDQAHAYFGRAVATAGDVNGDLQADLLIGAEGYDKPGDGMGPDLADVGRAYVYYASGDGLELAWTAEGTQVGAAFGASVTTVGDLNGDGCSEVAVGAYLADSEGEKEILHAGKVSIFESQQCAGLSTVPSQTLNGEQENAGFGYALAYAGDVNGDGHPDLLVGAPYYGQANEYTKEGGWESENDLGKIYLFAGNASGGLDTPPFWTQVGEQADGLFGFSVGAAGDVNGDRYADLVVGAPLQGVSADGRVYVYQGAPLNLSLEATLVGFQAGAQFGYAVNTAGDVNGDGYADLLIGAPFYQGTSADAGKVFLYYGAAQALSSTPDWAVQGSQTSRLGYAVSSAGDVNGDGFADLVVGAPIYNPGSQTMAGQAQLYFGGPDTPRTSPGWTSESTKIGAQWGYAVNASGDYNGDGYADLVIGAPYYTNGQTNEGQVTVYYGTAQGWGSTPSKAWESNKSSANFGYAVAPAGDINGDGYTDLMVGAPNFTSGQQGQLQEGKVFVYYGSANGLGSAAAWTKESNQGYAWLGQAVSPAGDVNGDGYADVIVGAPGYDGQTMNGGRALLYLGSQYGLSASPAWTADSDVAEAMFGAAVSAADMNGDGYSDLIIGAWKYNKSESQMLPDEGAVFIYYGAPTSPGTTYNWAMDGHEANANFGKAVTSGDVNGDGYGDVLIGAPKADDNWLLDEGKVYLYLGSSGGIDLTPRWIAEGHETNAQLGTSVSLSGDVNGDGLADALLGSPYTNGTLTDEGAVFLYYGTHQGLNSTPTWSATSTQGYARMGLAVAAGDANGDGFAEIIAGVPLYDPPSGGVLANVGQVQVFYGNGVPGLSLHPRLQQELNGVAWPVAPLGLLDHQLPYEFKLEMEGLTPFGCGRVRLEVEAKPQGTLFDGTALQTSEEWADTCNPSTATTLHTFVENLTVEYSLYHWRARLVYHPADFPFQQHSRWVSQPWHGWEEAAFRTNEATQPTSTHTLSGTVGADGIWYVSEVEVTLAGTDPLPENGNASGLAGLSYFVGDVCRDTGPQDEKLWVPYTGPFTIKEDGTHTLCYRAQDVAGNVQTSPSLNQTFFIDTTRPQITVSVAGLGPDGLTRFDPAIVTLYAQDPAPAPGQAGSGIALVQYRVDSAPEAPWLDYTGVFAITGDGPHTLEYQAWDVAGNWLPPETLAFETDASAPRILELTPAPFALTNDAYPAISFKVDHSGSGLPAAVTMYLDGQEVTPGSSPFYGGNPVAYTFIPPNPLLDGTHTVYVLAEDVVGNRTETFWQFTLDTETWVEGLAPVDGAVSNREAMTLTLGTEPGQLITVTVQGGNLVQTYTTTNGLVQVPGWPLSAPTNLLQITAEDPAGNQAQTTLTLMYNPAVHTAQVSASPDIFKVSTDPLMGDPNRPQISFQAQVMPKNANWRLTGWEIRLYPEGSQTPLPILSDLSTRLLPAAGKPWAVNWNGRLENGQPVPEGVYTYQLVASLTLGQEGQTQEVVSPVGTLVLDSTPPAPPTLLSIPASTNAGQLLVWFRYAVAVWGTAPEAEWVVLSYASEEEGVKESVQIPVRVTGGTWFANLPLSEGQQVHVFATAVDAAGNQSDYSASLHVGLAHENIFETPFATVSPLQIGVDMDVTLNATVRTGGADLVWVAASLPVEPYHLGLIPVGPQTYTGTWHTPKTGNYQGVALMVFQALDTATPPVLDEVLVTPYLDLIPPWIAIHQPADGYLVGGQTLSETALLTVTGVAEPYSLIQVIAQPEETGDAPTPGLIGYAHSDGTGAWATTLILPLAGFSGGPFLLTAQATDPVGNLGPVATAHLILDFTGPVIEQPWAVPMYLNPTLAGVDSTTLHVNLHDAETGVVGAAGVVYGVPDASSVSEPEAFFSETVNLFGLQIAVPDGTVEGKKDIQITAWDWVFNASILTATAFIVDKTSPTLTNLTLIALGENLYTPDPQTVWHGPASAGQNLRVSVTVNDENPPLDWMEVAGVDFVTFPTNVLAAGDGGAVDAQAAVYDTQLSMLYPATLLDTESTPTVTATDRAGNLSAASGFTVLWDALEPLIQALQISVLDGSQVYVPLGTTTLYYGQNPTTGQVEIKVEATDSGAGVKAVTFPALLGQEPFDVTEVGADGKFGRIYSIAAPSGAGEPVIEVADRVGNLETTSFLVYQDVLSPTVLLTVTQATDDFEVSWDISDPELDGGVAGSGLAAYTVEVCTDGPTACDNLVSNPGTSGTHVYAGQTDHTYTFRVTATDHVDNETTQESVENTASVTKYYLFGGQRVAMRVGTGDQSAVYYLHGDHLGSVSMTTNALGEIESQTRFTPFGEELTVEGSGEAVTDFGFTGQRTDSYIKLLDYGARWYDARLGRFISADNIIPNGWTPVAWDRFSYVQNNPLNYNDPTGNVACDLVGECGDNGEFAEGDGEATMHISDLPPVGLTHTGDPIPGTEYYYAMGGDEVYQYYLDYIKTCGWWNNNCTSEFGFEEFIGLWIFVESNGDSKNAAAIITAIAQYLFVGADGGKPICSQTCFSTVLNWIGAYSWGGDAMFRNAGPGSTVMDDYAIFRSKNEAYARFLISYWGAKALNPDSVITKEPIEGPIYWGNTRGAAPGGNLKAPNGYNGLGGGTVYYRNGNFVVYSQMQKDSLPKVDWCLIGSSDPTNCSK